MKRIFLFAMLFMLWPHKAQAQSGYLVSQQLIEYSFQTTECNTCDLLQFTEDVVVQTFFSASEVDPVVGGFYVCGYYDTYENDLWTVRDLTAGGQIISQWATINIFDSEEWAGCFYTPNYGTADRQRRTK